MTQIPINQLAEAAPQSIWTLWIRELKFSWFWIFIFSVAPSLVFGSALPAMVVLLAAVLVGIPSTAINRFRSKESGQSGLRRLTIWIAVPILSLTCVFNLDKLTPENATPISDALVKYQIETGRYPDSIEALVPKYLVEMPNLNYWMLQPRVTYRIADGKPYLAVSSARGDAFAHYEYDFETKTWKHNS